MTLTRDWKTILSSVKIREEESLNSWYHRVGEANGLSYHSVRAGAERHGKILFPEIFNRKCVVKHVSNSPGLRSNVAVKPDFTHFSSADWQLPDGREEVKKQHVIEGKTMLAIMDIHLPFHDKQALIAAIDEGKRRNVDVVLLNGDVADCISLSRFNKSNFDRSFKDELDLERGFLKWLREQFPKAEILFKEGNHEKRFEDYIRRNADALDNIEEIQLKSLLRLDTWRMTHIEHTQIMKFGKLNIIHGHEYFGGGSINVARGYLVKAFDNILLGHRHTSQDYIFKKVNQELVGAWSVGCLCKLMPAYMSLNQWSHGFAIIEKYSDDNFSVENKKLMNGKIL